MVTTRYGLYGEYYGSPYNSSSPLTEEQMKINATYIYNSLINSGFTINSICGMLGNMETESSINPGRWQGDRVGSEAEGHGYSLVQWTPYTKYTNWCFQNGYDDPSEMDSALARINYEVLNNIQWSETEAYPYSFNDFKTSLQNPYDLALMFLANYERPLDPNQPIRGQQALKWYNYLGGITPSYHKKKVGFKWVLYANKLRNKFDKQ